MVDHPVRFAIVNIVENHTIKAIAPHLERNVASVARTIILRLCVSLAHLSTKGTTVDKHRPRSKRFQERNFMRST